MLDAKNDAALQAHTNWLLATDPEVKQSYYEKWRCLVEAATPATEVVLYTDDGLVQYYESEADLLAHKNRFGDLYELRNGAEGCELWHKAWRVAKGKIEVITTRC